MTNNDFNWQILHENNLLFALQYLVRAKTFHSFQSNLLYNKFNKTITVSTTNWKDIEPNEERQENDKKAKRLAKRRERRRQRLAEETAEERETRLGKRREAWKKDCWGKR
jgi:hypothetical protein